MTVENINAAQRADANADIDLASQKRLLAELRSEATAFGCALSTAFANGVVEGKRFSDVLKSIGLRLAETLLKADFKPVELGLARRNENDCAGMPAMTTTDV
jgi:hypothetical protein